MAEDHRQPRILLQQMNSYAAILGQEAGCRAGLGGDDGEIDRFQGDIKRFGVGAREIEHLFEKHSGACRLVHDLLQRGAACGIDGEVLPPQ